MILVDTSVWIEFLSGRPAWKATPDDLLRFVTCGPVVQEVLQGLKPVPAAVAFREAFLALPRLADPLPIDLFLEAAEIYRDGRTRGHTIRSSNDCLIAAIAINQDVPVWHRDRDFTVIARFTRLKIHMP